MQLMFCPYFEIQKCKTHIMGINLQTVFLEETPPKENSSVHPAKQNN